MSFSYIERNFKDISEDQTNELNTFSNISNIYYDEIHNLDDSFSVIGNNCHNDYKENSIINFVNNNTDDSSSKEKKNLGKKEKVKKGRKKQIDNEREHNKLARDNIKRKIQVRYLKFLRNFLNYIIEKLYISPNNKKYKFFPLDYGFAKIISKEKFNLLKLTKIGDIFKDHGSPKFKNHEQLNLEVYNEVRKNEVIKNILDKTYLEFFYIFYLKKDKINLSPFGLEEILNLVPELGFYEDLKKDEEKNNEYIKKMEKCIKNDFLGSPIFVIN